MKSVFRGFYIRPDMCHRETLVFFTSTVWAFSEILLDCIEFEFTSAIETDILPRTDFLSSSYFFSQFYHQIVTLSHRLYITFVRSIKILCIRLKKAKFSYFGIHDGS